MLSKLFSSILGLALLASAPAVAQVWVDENSWSPAWEDRYENWVRSSWQVDMFARKTLPNGRANPFHGLRADCADTVYTMRILFAYENRLPFAVQDPTNGSRKITNRMTRFNSTQDPDQRVRKFLVAMFNTLSTASLPSDTYPVALNPQSIRPGGLILTTKANHHSWTLKEMLNIGVPHLVYSSRIAATSSPMFQERQSWPNPYWVFEGNHSPSGHAGFRAFRPLEYIGQPVWNVPGYSEEQYRTPLSKWVKTATGRLATRQETDEQMLSRLMKSACQELQARVGAVNDGVLYLRGNPRCMNYATYDNYSTPNRDQRFFDSLVAVRVAYKDILQTNGASKVSGQLRRQLDKVFPLISSSSRQETSSMGPQSLTSDSYCQVTYAPGKTIDLAEAKRRVFAGLFSSNPHDSIEYRWGERRGQSSLASSCQSWDPWSPDFNTAN